MAETDEHTLRPTADAMSCILSVIPEGVKPTQPRLTKTLRRLYLLRVLRGLGASVAHTKAVLDTLYPDNQVPVAHLLAVLDGIDADEIAPTGEHSLADEWDIAVSSRLVEVGE